MALYDPFKDYLGLSDLFMASKNEIPKSEDEESEAISSSNFCSLDCFDVSLDMRQPSYNSAVRHSQRFQNDASLDANIIESSQEIDTSPNFKELMGQVGRNGSFEFHDNGNMSDTHMDLMNLELGRPDTDEAHLIHNGVFSSRFESGLSMSTECVMFPSMSDISSVSCGQFQPFARPRNPPVLRSVSYPNGPTERLPYSSNSSSFANIPNTLSGNGASAEELNDSNYSSNSEVSDLLFRLKDFLDAQPQSGAVPQLCDNPRRYNTNLDGKFCALCKRNGETKEFYTTHVLKDNRGKVICPILRKYVCPQCNATEDNAHTLRHCPLTAGASSSTETFRTRRSSCGYRRKPLW